MEDGGEEKREVGSSKWQEGRDGKESERSERKVVWGENGGGQEEE